MIQLDNLWKGALIGMALGLVINVYYIFGGPIGERWVHSLVLWATIGGTIGYFIDEYGKKEKKE